MFFLFGFGTKRRDLGPGEVRTCPRCGNTSRFTRIRQFRQFSVFFVPVLRWKRRQLEVCGICGTAVPVGG
ncbi:zinc-ribbon domain-containing protein [Blastococcus capsensis]|uniref:zinc-ribbon domain-containing protein n=1 Tax=Blastococcus capsensis TaxID=1564163 RepID=UPI002541BAB7|nr:zinc-ribbon domain-containing protein [Blastococcus capsensis]MDK3257538.1 zinc-ribbon domain-containing protein [Blastococcus capsensis]